MEPSSDHHDAITLLGVFLCSFPVPLSKSFPALVPPPAAVSLLSTGVGPFQSSPRLCLFNVSIGLGSGATGGHGVYLGGHEAADGCLMLVREFGTVRMTVRRQ